MFRVFMGVQPVESDRASGSGDGSETVHPVNIFTGDPQKKPTESPQKISQKKPQRKSTKENDSGSGGVQGVQGCSGCSRCVQEAVREAV